MFEKNLFCYHVAFHKEIMHGLQGSDISQYYSILLKYMYGFPLEKKTTCQSATCFVSSYLVS